MLSHCNKNTFGWNPKTHMDITRFALKNSSVKIDDKYKKILIKYSKQPDIDETQFHSSSHFCFAVPKNFKTRPFLSFLDLSGRNNALFKTKYHMKKAKKHAKKGKMKKAFKELGRMIHFATQDNCQPDHIKKSSLVGKIMDAKKHIEFENFTEPLVEDFLVKTKPMKPKKYENFEDTVLNCFKDNFHFASQYKVTKQNRPSWYYIAKSTIEKAHESTQIVIESFVNQYMKNAA